MKDNKISSSISEPFSDNVKKLAELFPSVVKDGEVDFDALKAELGEFTEVGKESYSLNWAGKVAAQKETGKPLVGKTLKYTPSESKNPDTTENIYIEGDNLEALKLLQNSYRGKIDFVYIDPPYNTGNDFIYKDNFSKTQVEIDQEEGRISEDGDRLQQNPKTSAKYHAKWLSMMYPRLRLAKNLLSEKGAICISIDDNETANLREICDEIFGETNFLVQIVWQKRTSPDARRKLSTGHEYILVYMKNISFSEEVLNYAKIGEEDAIKYINPDSDPRGPWVSTDFGAQGYRPNQMYKIVTPGGKEYYPTEGRCWKNTEEGFQKLLKEGRMWFGSDGCGVPRKKLYLSERDGKSTWTWWTNTEAGHTQEATQQLTKLLGKKTIFDYPKPVRLIERLIELFTHENALILDFFSGSATTAEATFKSNLDDKQRSFILIQLPESCSENSDAFHEGYVNICEIGKERIRRAGAIIEKDHPDVDTGFKVFRVADTNIRWIAAESGTPGVTLEDALTSSSKDLRDFMPGSNDLDLVYEILIRQYDIPLTAKIESLKTIGRRTYSIADTIIVCLEENVTDAIIDKIAAIEPIPQKIVFRDSGFNDNISLKENAMMRLDALMQKHASGGKQPYSVEFL